MNDQQQKPALPKPTVYDQLYPGRFIKAGELLGKKVTLTITDVNLDRLVGDDGKDKVKALISFKETEKQLVACKTNGLCIKEMFGAQLSNWTGKRITIFEDTWNGEPCTRVWGSPDIPQDLEVTISLPRRRPFKKTMHRMTKSGAPNGPAKTVIAGAPSDADSIAAAKTAETLESLSSHRESVWAVYAASGKGVPLPVEAAFDDRKAALEQSQDEIPL